METQEETVVTTPAAAVDSSETVTVSANVVESTTSPEKSAQAQTPAADTNAEKRISDLTSKWQSQEALAKKNGDEVTRLQSLLASAVAESVGLKEQIASLEQGQSGTVTNLEGKVKDADAKVAALTAENATLKAQNTKLKFITDNSDLLAYATILPDTEDITALNAAASTVRNARQGDKDRIKDALTTPNRGGQTPRTGNTSMSASDLHTYLSEAVGTPEYEKRLKEVTAMSQSK